MRHTCLIVMAFTLLPIPPVALAQTPPPLETSAPTLKVYSRETIVDVTVTDAHGNPVHKLTRNDFTISENGNPQPIRSFQEFGVAPPKAAPPLPKLPPGVYTNYQATPATGPVNIFLLDALHSNFALAYETQQAILKYLANMTPGTQVAVFWLSGSGLHLLQGFTSDPAVIRRAVSVDRPDVGSSLDTYTDHKYTIAAFEQIARYVSGIKGRKNLLWFTPGMPVNLMRDGGYAWGLADNGHIAPPPDMTEIHHLMDAYEMLTAEQVAVYPINPSGVQRMSGAFLRSNEVAEDTGGIAFYESNDVAKLITDAVDNGAHFYTLSYIPPNPIEDGHYHSIKITVDRPGLHLVYRHGYNAEDPPPHQLAPGLPTMEAAIEGNTAPATLLFFDAQATEAPHTPAHRSSQTQAESTATASAAASAKGLRFDILYLVPQSQIAFSNGPNGTRTASLQFEAAAYDDTRKQVAFVTQTMNLPLTPDEYRQFIQTPFKFSQQLDLPDGQITLRLGVLDGVSNKAGTLEIPLMIGIPRKHRTIPPAATPTGCPPRCALPAPPTL